MTGLPDPEDFEPVPPTPERVAARALVLASVACRGLIEVDAGKPGAEELRRQIIKWLGDLGITDEVETRELEQLTTPLGQLDHKQAIDASWRSEGVLILGWALHRNSLLPFFRQCEPSDVANALGFLGNREETLLYRPRLRDIGEIEHYANVYLTVHWRLREFSLRPDLIDYQSFVARCNWGSLTLDGLQVIDQDLAIDRVRLDHVEESTFRNSLGITQERHQAFNWLLGLEPIYSRVTTDT